MRGINEKVGVLVAKAGTANSTPLVSSYILPKTRRVALIAVLGDMAAETIDVAIYRASDSSGTGAESAKAATQLAAHASNNDNGIIIIELNDDEFSESKPYLAGRAVTGGATGGPVGLVLVGMDTREDEMTSIDSSSIKEIKR